MTIQETIGRVDKLTPNHYPTEMKVGWLSKLDGQIFKEVMLTHADCAVETFKGYEDASPDTELLVPYPYDEDIYVYFLQAQISKENGEAAKFNQSSTLYNSAYLRFLNWYNRTHVPLPAATRFKF